MLTLSKYASYSFEDGNRVFNNQHLVITEVLRKLNTHRDETAHFRGTVIALSRGVAE